MAKYSPSRHACPKPLTIPQTFQTNACREPTVPTCRDPHSSFTCYSSPKRFSITLQLRKRICNSFSTFLLYLLPNSSVGRVPLKGSTGSDRSAPAREVRRPRIQPHHRGWKSLWQGCRVSEVSPDTDSIAEEPLGVDVRIRWGYTGCDFEERRAAELRFSNDLNPKIAARMEPGLME
jgi:hypothetical protein